MLSTSLAYQRLGDLRSITVTKGNEAALANAKETAAAWEAEHGGKVEIFEIVPVPVPLSQIPQSVRDNMDRVAGSLVNEVVLEKKMADFEIAKLTRASQRIVDLKATISQYRAKMEHGPLDSTDRQGYQDALDMLTSETYSHGEIEDVTEMMKAYQAHREELAQKLEALKGTLAYAAWTRNFTEDGTIL